MNNLEFVKKVKEIESLPTRYYSVAGGDWAKWNGSSWNFDCVILVKAILWGWNGNKNHPHGGANYGSNGVYDDGTEQIIGRCNNISNDFNNIQIGELLWMNGHVGVYVGNRDVIECTAGWEGGVLYSKIGPNGERTRNGKQIYSWKKHGKLPYLNYENVPDVIKNEVNVFYRVRTQKHGWLPEVSNLNDYAGWEESPVTDVAIRVDSGAVRYRVHTVGGRWLPFVSGCNISDSVKGYAGIGKPIDAVEVYYYTPSGVRPLRKAKYKVNEYPWQYDNETSNGADGYAGVIGIPITKFQITIE